MEATKTEQSHQMNKDTTLIKHLTHEICQRRGFGFLQYCHILWSHPSSDVTAGAIIPPVCYCESIVKTYYLVHKICFFLSGRNAYIFNSGGLMPETNLLSDALYRIKNF